MTSDSVSETIFRAEISKYFGEVDYIHIHEFCKYNCVCKVYFSPHGETVLWRWSDPTGTEFFAPAEQNYVPIGNGPEAFKPHLEAAFEAFLLAAAVAQKEYHLRVGGYVQ